MRTEWTRGPHTENGAYGIYPVQTENVLVEGAVAIAASDAGIYVGQSKNVIVRDSLAEYNVAGIEIENTVGADVYNNVADQQHRRHSGVQHARPAPGRTQHPGFQQPDNGSNNTGNFAPPGGAVSGVPAGSGVIINSNDKVEIFENEISNNQTANVLISSFFSASYSCPGNRTQFRPVPGDHSTSTTHAFSGGGDAPDREELETLRAPPCSARAADCPTWSGTASPTLKNPARSAPSA